MARLTIDYNEYKRKARHVTRKKHSGAKLQPQSTAKLVNDMRNRLTKKAPRTRHLINPKNSTDTFVPELGLPPHRR